MSNIVHENLAKLNINRQEMIAAGFSSQKYDDVQRGKSNYKLNEIICISEKFHLSLDYLLKESLPDSYIDCYVAFIDILGFKEFILDKSSTFEKVKSLFDLMKLIYAEQSFVIQSDVLTTKMMRKVKVNFVSDTVILSIPKFEKNSLEVLIFVIDVFISNVLLNHQLLFRGAISEGAFYSCNDIIFGPSIVNAAILESKNAIYPRIIIPSNIVDSYNSTASVDSMNGIKYLIEKDSVICDDFYIINYLKYTINRMNETAQEKKYNVEMAFDKFKSKIETTICNSTNESVLQKNIYIANYFNIELESIKKKNILNFKCENITIPTNCVFNSQKKKISPELSEDKQRLLVMYDLLTDMEKGEVLGELKVLTRDRSESKNAENVS